MPSWDPSDLQLQGQDKRSPCKGEAAQNLTGKESSTKYPVESAIMCTSAKQEGPCMRKRQTKHEVAVKKQDQKNGIAVHAWKSERQVDWESAKVKQVVPNLSHRRIAEALHIHQIANTTNLDCGLTLDSIWFPLPHTIPPPPQLFIFPGLCFSYFMPLCHSHLMMSPSLHFPADPFKFCTTDKDLLL